MGPVQNNGGTRGGITGRGFMPGRSGNPGGRPKGLAKASRALVGEDGMALFELWWSIANDPIRRDSDRLEASRLLADRGWGKPAVFTARNPLPRLDRAKWSRSTASGSSRDPDIASLAGRARSLIAPRTEAQKEASRSHKDAAGGNPIAGLEIPDVAAEESDQHEAGPYDHQEHANSIEYAAAVLLQPLVELALFEPPKPMPHGVGHCVQTYVQLALRTLGALSYNKCFALRSPA
jgi:hypothetical protein